MVTTAYPPYFSPDLPDGGPITEIVTAAFKVSGLEVSVTYVPWARALKQAVSGAADGLMGAWRTPDREALFHFTDPMPQNEIVLFKRRGDGPDAFTDFAALKGYRLGVVRGYANPPELKKSGVDVVIHKSDHANLAALGRSRVGVI